MMNFRRKQILAENQIEKMVKVKAELECFMAEKDQLINRMRERIHNKAINNDENQHAVLAAGVTSNDSVAIHKDPSSHCIGANNAIGKGILSTSSTSSTSSVDMSRTLENMNENIIVYDSKDPNRPRFTLRELQKVIMEKNELTIKLDKTQDELDLLKNQLVYSLTECLLRLI